MNNEIFELIKNQISNDIIHLSEQFNVPIDATLELMVSVHNRSYFKRDKRKYKELERLRCTARTWNNGKPGGRCSRSSTEGSDFCMTHAGLKMPKWCRGCFLDYGENRFHNYQWEHFGRYTDPLPKCFICNSCK